MNYNLLKKYIVNKYPQLGKLIKYKFDLKWEENEKDHVLGADNGYIEENLKEDGDWNAVLAGAVSKGFSLEDQFGRFLETMGCTGYGTLNAMELIAFLKWLEVWNKSDRFTNKASGTTQNGNNINNVFESIRKTHGTVNEEDYSWDRDTFNWNQYYQTIPQNVLDKGINWLKEYTFNYKIVSPDHAGIKDALKKSPVGVGVYAWYKKGDLYYSAGNANHWCIIIGQVWGSHYLVLDSYPPYIKKLDWNFKFSFPRAFFLNKKEAGFNMEEIKKLKEEGYEYIIRAENNGEFSKITDNGLEYIPKITSIADEIAERLKLSPENVNEMLKFLTQEKKLKWLDEKGYYKLIK